MSKLVERLRDLAPVTNAETRAAMTEAALEIERLRAALAPFAALADRYDPVEDDDEHTIWCQTALPTLGQLRRARAALETREAGVSAKPLEGK